MHPRFEWILANHCAPVLLGKKPAALLAEKALPKPCPWALLKQRGFCVISLSWRGKAPLTLLYHPALLRAVLSQHLVSRKLAAIGYPVEGDWQAHLNFLRRRFDQSWEFPHEIGFFLGYPPEDVIGFMENRTTCKLSGPWKVFGDVERAQAIFEEYAQCKRILLSHIENGGSILIADPPTLTV
ncbi:MAG: DUF3793 family protein [Christensenellales bacterium]